jgi:hypothetical protein
MIEREADIIEGRLLMRSALRLFVPIGTSSIVMPTVGLPVSPVLIPRTVMATFPLLPKSVMDRPGTLV